MNCPQRQSLSGWPSSTSRWHRLERRVARPISDLTAYLEQLDKRLEQARISNQATRSVLRKELNKVKATSKQLVPKPGYPGDKPDLKPLRDTITVGIRSYEENAVWYGVVGPQYPAGAHGHLVEGWRKPRENMTITNFIEASFKKHERAIVKAVGVELGKQITGWFKR